MSATHSAKESARKLLEIWPSRAVKEVTRRCYFDDLSDFQKFAKTSSPEDSVAFILSHDGKEANELAVRYIEYMAKNGNSPATIRRRIATLGSMLKAARTLGLVYWIIAAPLPANEPVRDMSGPTNAEWNQLLAYAVQQADAGNGLPASVRNLAIIRLLHDLGLRCFEVVGLDMCDVEIGGGWIDILGKGRTQKERLILPDPPLIALWQWVDVRGEDAGPVFVNFTHTGRDLYPARLTVRSVWRVVTETASAAGIERVIRPHGLRHLAITQALDATGGDTRRVQKFARIINPKNMVQYDDRRHEPVTDIAEMVSRR